MRRNGLGLGRSIAPPTGSNESVHPAKQVVPDLLERLHIEAVNSGACHGDWIAEPAGAELISFTPATGEPLARVRMAGPADYEAVMARAAGTFLEWRMMPAPKRGDIVREIGNELRANKQDLGALVSLEMGKILPEGLGEVQEMIDIADFAVGLSRQLYGLTMHSERPGHRMYEQWHPLGIVGVISAFNFPVAVWAWNAMIAAVCGDCVLWRPSSETPLAAVAVQKIVNRVFDRHGLKGVFNLVIGPSQPVAESLVRDPRIPLVSFTGSTEVGRHVSAGVAQRLGRSILELGGNNGIIVMDDANPDLVLRAVLFGAVGTAGQRCNTTRRLFLHCGIANINIGTSGAEIGGAFGGEKDTGGGRESGSDSWKAYMRRQTNTLNWSSQLPLAQGIEFKL